MSRRVQRTVMVSRCGDRSPESVRFKTHQERYPVLEVLDHWREWFNILDGEPERDVWQVRLPIGVCELHCVRYPLSGQRDYDGDWVLYRWED